MITCKKKLLLLVFTFVSFKINAQQFKVVDNKGTINTVNNNTVTSATTAPLNPLEGDIWIDTNSPNDVINIYDALPTPVWKQFSNQNIYTENGTITTDRTITGNTANRFNIGSFKGFFIYNTEYIDLRATQTINLQATNGVDLRSNTIAHENFQVMKVFLDKDGDFGATGQVLSSTGIATNWVDNTAVSTWLALDDNLTADKNDTKIYKNDNVGIGDFSATTIDAQLHVKSTDVPFKIEPNTTTPTGTSGGQMFVDSTNGILYIYDGTRMKWLSVDRTMIGWGRDNNNTTDQYLRQFNGAPSNKNGWRMIRNATITAITAQTDIDQTWTLEIRKNDGTTAIASLIMTNQQGNHNNILNIDVNEGDFIQAYCNGTSVDFPQTLIEIAWRK
ncbi:hypothetical protein [Tenacibaculum dicentrarchi]|uniref:hypothetical protein n=1 Tax=Tenacibaculum dicentrarchi TaxID=669041 RepID=UPI000C7D87E1|nr:conserved exported hypothetical protein [Tenacibaculum dicentrarchi]